MKIFIAGSTGVIGRNLIPLLVKEGHMVTALIRDPKKSRLVQDLGTKSSVANVFDREGMIESMKKIKPEVVVNELTALSKFSGNFRKFDKEFELTNRFRTEGTDILLSAAKISGARRYVGQSFCGWPFAREGEPVKYENDPLDPDPPAAMRRSHLAIRYLEEKVQLETEIEAVALRYGFFYGPGTAVTLDSPLAEAIRNRKLPIVGNGSGIWSFIHIRDAAKATARAITADTCGIYNVVDDEPAPVSTWLPFLAGILGGKSPHRIPVWMARIFMGGGGVSMMTSVRGGSNLKARNELDWQPDFHSWRTGFIEGL